MGKHHDDDTRRKEERREVQVKEKQHEDRRKKHSKTVKIAAGIIVVAILGLFLRGFVFASNSSPAQDVNPVSTEVKTVDGVQIAELGWKGNNYYPNTITVKSGMPVRIEARMDQLKGCFRVIVIPKLGVSKYLFNDANTIEFTPQTPGTYRFSCSMGMGSGTLVVQ